VIDGAGKRGGTSVKFITLFPWFYNHSYIFDAARWQRVSLLQGDMYKVYCCYQG